MKVLFALFLMMAVAHAHDWSHKDFAQSTQYQRNWLQGQKSPKTGGSCCGNGDSEQVDEEIRYDAKGNANYWINSRHTRGQWMMVPDEVVLREPNMHGRPVAWFRWGIGNNAQSVPNDNLPVSVFCYAPGPLL